MGWQSSDSTCEKGGQEKKVRVRGKKLNGTEKMK
jgi:hypothetical protein